MIGYYLIALGVLLLLLFVYILRGPTIWDRMQGMNLMSSVIVLSIVLYAVLAEEPIALDIAIAFGLLGFVGTQFIAIFVRKRGNI